MNFKQYIKMDKNKYFNDKVCLASCIKFTSSEQYYKSVDNKYFKFITSISTILARDNEVVATYIEHINNEKTLLYLAKNSKWLDEDKKYINVILNNLKDISKIDNKSLVAKSKQSKEITDIVINYCKNKINKRIDKLKKDLNKLNINNNFEKLNIFKNNIIKSNSYKEIIVICAKYYRNDESKIKYRSNDKDNKIFKHILKVASYANSINKIITCANDNEYKMFFKKDIIIKYSEPIRKNIKIRNWKDLLCDYIPNENDRNIVIKECINNYNINNKINEIYKNDKQEIYYHGELHIIKYLMDKGIDKNCYIGVSKLCCFLCYQYINYLNKNNKYKFVVSGTHGKLYHRWMLPKLNNEIININIENELCKIINNIIVEELNKYTDIRPDSDSIGGSIDDDDIIVL